MSLSIKSQLSKLSNDALISILESLYNEDSRIKKVINRNIAIHQDDGKALIKLLDKEVNSIKRSKKFLDYYEVGSLEKQINNITSLIKQHLISKDPAAAIRVLKSLLGTVNQSVERVDDSNGGVGICYSEAFTLLGEAYCNASNIDIKALVDFLMQSIKENEYNMFDGFAKSFHGALGKDGLSLLESRILDTIPFLKEGAYTLHKYTDILLEISDCRKDIDSYISILEKYYTLNDTHYIAVASRYMKSWQEEDALLWLEKVNNKDTDDYVDLMSEVLRILGKTKESIDILCQRFKQCLSLDYYHKLIKYQKEPEAMKAKLLKIILEHEYKLEALNILCDIREYSAASAIILKDPNAYINADYYPLKEIAKKLSTTEYSLAAIIMYRLVIADLVSRAKGKYYTWAVSYISKIIDLSLTVKDWQGFGDNISFILDLKEVHFRKGMFWEEYHAMIKQKYHKKPSVDFKPYEDLLRV